MPAGYVECPETDDVIRSCPVAALNRGKSKKGKEPLSSSEKITAKERMIDFYLRFRYHVFRFDYFTR